jgi:hypothetical protein
MSQFAQNTNFQQNIQSINQVKCFAKGLKVKSTSLTGLSHFTLPAVGRYENKLFSSNAFAVPNRTLERIPPPPRVDAYWSNPVTIVKLNEPPEASGYSRKYEKKISRTNRNACYYKY